MPKTYILMFGIQGAGKGTQARRLASKLGLLHLSTGDLLRDVASQGNELAKKISDILHSGSLVPDNIMMKILSDRLNLIDAREGVVFDGYPRTLNQAFELDQLFLKEENSRIIAIVLELNKEDLWNRVSYRMNCPNCGAIYNSISKIPIKTNTCDECSHVGLERREDDIQLDAVEKRIQEFEIKTKPLIDFYHNHQDVLFLSIDANNSIEDVFQEIMSKLEF